MRDGSSIT